MTAKEITLDYLKSIQKDLLNSTSITRGANDLPLQLMIEHGAVNQVIRMVEESEGE